MAEAVGSARTCTAFCTVALMMDSASIALYPCATDLLSLTFNILPFKGKTPYLSRPNTPRPATAIFIYNI